MPDIAPVASTGAASPIARWGSLMPTADLLLLASFFLSGASALVYQVGWQRALYAQIGVDIDSITIIVSVFMLGIGIGGMLGGWMADRWPRARLLLYAGIEFAIGAFGLVSLALLPWLVGAVESISSGASAIVAACFLFLLVPTVLMGTTLPLLTVAFDERRSNIGVSVGTLYFTNTLGAGAGAAVVPMYLFDHWTLPEVIRLAALGNFTVIACVLAAVFATRTRP